MSHCRDEHDHSRDGHGHGHHGHDHDHDGPERGAEESLYSRIDRDNVRCLNEREPTSGKNVIKPWNEREDTTKHVESDIDEQLIIFIPFTGSIKLKSILIKAGPGDSCPSMLKAYINREDVDFDTVEGYTATQEWELVQSPDVVEYQTRITKMYNVRNLTLYFPENFGDEITRIYYIGLKGEWTEIKKDHVITLYEATPNPADHKNPSGENKAYHAID
ncbi:hypothetical protein RclHR1_10910004 [Rhizophagus clarus]|uniref:PITH domain-containing protein n=1 Tax=Rhizophagus clarus TaxID=94130 RepID=A0A2Z6Q2U8_9GLOM|nr:hypothetical protein RclHR1_10910004 [Rhizophagus clarus]